MRVCVIGAGAIGGYLAARLASAGHELTLLARGETLKALNARGLELIEADGSSRTHRLRAVSSALEAGAHDVVILATKAHQLSPLLGSMAALWHEDTVVIPMQNGIPFWYFQALEGPHKGRVVESVDPGGAILAAIPASRIVGCVVYPACEVAAPGVIRHVEGERFPLGELDGSNSARIQRISAAFAEAGLKSPVLTDIRSEIWLKLWGNLCLNPLSALGRATLRGICANPEARALAKAMMEEAAEVAIRLGASFRVSVDRRLDGAAKVGDHKTSMLQDVEAGRKTEIDALLGSVIELARLSQVPVPRLEAVYACMRLLEENACPPDARSMASVPARAAA